MGEIGNPRLDFFSVTSTLDIARAQAERFAPHGTLITASHQTAGRGRRGAQWRDDPGASALMTFILRSATSPEQAWRIPFLASLAGAQFLQSAGFDSALVKWPNDLVIDGCKVGGVLVEAMPSAKSGLNAYLLGVGINVMQEDFGDAATFQMPPTSLTLSYANSNAIRKCNAVDVIEGYTHALDQLWDEYIDAGPALIDAWRAYQLTGQYQRGIELATSRESTGIYRDIRSSDGAGLIELAGCNTLTAIMPAAS